ncbi:MAG: beta-ketoacyl-ACP synthase III [Anaerolineae bacterium]
MSRYAAIIGWGKHLPERVMTNHDLAKMIDTSDDWIRTRTGIEARHFADPKEATSDLATRAAWQALERADLDPSELDLIVVATCSPDYHLPSTSCFVQEHLGATKAAAFDLNAACSGFVYALSMATQSIVTGMHNNVLVIGAETLSRWIDWNERTTAVLFGDGAGAVVLQASPFPSGVQSFVLGADGTGTQSLILRNGGSRIPPVGVMPSGTGLSMNGNEVYRFATRVMGRAAKEALEKAHLTPDDISLFIPHQANLRIIESAAKQINIPMDRVFVNIQKYGNTSAASIPIALCEAADEGRIQPGDNLCLVGFGAGLTWAAATVKWAPVLPAPGTGLPSKVARWSRHSLARARSLINRTERRLDSVEFNFGEQAQNVRDRMSRNVPQKSSGENGASNGSTQPSSNGTPPAASNGHGTPETNGAKAPAGQSEKE